MSVTYKILKRISDNRIEDKFAKDWTADPSTPNGWSQKVDTDLTHEIINSPDGDPHKIFYKDGAYQWKVEGTPEAWVARTDPEKDPEKLERSKSLRTAAMRTLRAARDAAQAVIDDPSSSVNLVSDMTIERDKFDSEISTHQTEYENIWVKGTNP